MSGREGGNAVPSSSKYFQDFNFFKPFHTFQVVFVLNISHVVLHSPVYTRGLKGGRA